MSKFLISFHHQKDSDISEVLKLFDAYSIRMRGRQFYIKIENMPDLVSIIVLINFNKPLITSRIYKIKLDLIKDRNHGGQFILYHRPVSKNASFTLIDKL